MQLSDIITEKTVKSYTRAAVAVARACDRLRDEGYGAMVVPSRGAVPVVGAASSYRRSILNPLIDRDGKFKLLTRSVSDPLVAAVHIPFSADMGETGVNGLDTASIRTFWARVVAAIARRDALSPYYQFYRFHRDVVCRVGHHDNLEHCLNSERFIFVDTVVSGRAVVEIADAFDDLGMDQIHYLLLVDENGSRIDPRYADRLRRLEAQGRAQLINVDRLFTEDQGPAVSGVWSVVMPSIMDAAREIVPEFRDGMVGAGIFYHEVQARKDGSNINFTRAIGSLNILLHSAMYIVADLDEIEQDLERLGLYFENELGIEQVGLMARTMERTFGYAIEDYVNHLDQHGLFAAEATAGVAERKLLGGVDGKPTLDVSGSHCLRLDVPADEAVRLVRRFAATRARAPGL